jgi:hypothetical protein
MSCTTERVRRKCPLASRTSVAPSAAGNRLPFSHNLHAGQLGMDCRYCHTGVDKSKTSVIPTAQTCMNCHNQVKPDSPLLAVVRQSYETGDPVPWVKVHEIPDFAFFHHAAHVNRGISCVECHGRIDTMDTVSHEQPLSMGFCLECHRAPETRVRAPQDVFNLASETIAAREGLAAGEKFVHDWNIKPPQSCTGCHR